MRLKKDVDIARFLSDVGRCESEVYFETEKGDCLTLKSTLSQYLFCTMADDVELISAGRIRFASEADRDLLIQYLEDC